MEPEGQFQGEKWGVFSIILQVRYNFYFMNQIDFVKVSSIQKNTLHPRCEGCEIMKIAHFSVKPLITLTCRNSLINPATTKFILEFLMRVANETICESLIDQ